MRSPACRALKLQCYSISKERTPDTATETGSEVKSLRSKWFALASVLPLNFQGLDLKPCSGHVV